MNWPTGPCIMFILRWFRILYNLEWSRDIGTNLPCFVYYYGPIVLWDNIVPHILCMYIVDFVILFLVNLVFGFPMHYLPRGNNPYGVSAITFGFGVRARIVCSGR